MIGELESCAVALIEARNLFIVAAAPQRVTKLEEHAEARHDVLVAAIEAERKPFVDRRARIDLRAVDDVHARTGRAVVADVGAAGDLAKPVEVTLYRCRDVERLEIAPAIDDVDLAAGRRSSALGAACCAHDELPRRFETREIAGPGARRLRREVVAHADFRSDDGQAEVRQFRGAIGPVHDAQPPVDTGAFGREKPHRDASIEVIGHIGSERRVGRIRFPIERGPVPRHAQPHVGDHLRAIRDRKRPGEEAVRRKRVAELAIVIEPARVESDAVRRIVVDAMPVTRAIRLSSQLERQRTRLVLARGQRACRQDMRR